MLIVAWFSNHSFPKLIFYYFNAAAGFKDEAKMAMCVSNKDEMRLL